MLIQNNRKARAVHKSSRDDPEKHRLSNFFSLAHRRFSELQFSSSAGRFVLHLELLVGARCYSVWSERSDRLIVDEHTSVARITALILPRFRQTRLSERAPVHSPPTVLFDLTSACSVHIGVTPSAGHTRRSTTAEMRTALLVIGMQKFFGEMVEPPLKHIQRLAHFCESWAMPVIFTQHGHTPEELIPPIKDQLIRKVGPEYIIMAGSKEWDLIPEIWKLAKDAPIAGKNPYSRKEHL